MSSKSLRTRVVDLEESALSAANFGLPRDPQECKELHERLKLEELHRIRSDPLEFRNELALILEQLEPWHREVIASAFNGDNIDHLIAKYRLLDLEKLEARILREKPSDKERKSVHSPGLRAIGG